MFTHYLITRFNLKVDTWKTTKKGDIVLTEEWLKDRFNLFEQLCLPSVLNQSNHNFIWNIYFDISTPILFKEKIVNLCENYSFIKIFFIDGNRELLLHLKKCIAPANKNYNDYVITTRLDNDDMIHKDFISTIQFLFSPTDKMVIDIRNGYQMDLEKTPPAFRHLSNRFNPFISFVEKVKNSETVFSRMHREWEKEKNIMIYNDKRLWVEVVHDKNKINSAKKELKQIYNVNFYDFGINDSKFNPGKKIFVFWFNIKIDIYKTFRNLKSKIIRNGKN